MPLSSSDLLSVLKEEDQVIELDATLLKDGDELFKIMMRDGVSVDVLCAWKRGSAASDSFGEIFIAFLSLAWYSDIG
ncbi:hypothetical protein [Microcoleus sp.]|uniref:hypothetical protein n=1 Tax=Microcoleus sp. TaxID=44472 RepID=UPI003524DFA8